ncbi:hypothetical protein BYT27DRAFT_7109273 [Phlegmacium glaucopus]|nr:hypothetical protein BYT27DRAFT_7109273 [Phlegmacium glaucopus]
MNFDDPAGVAALLDQLKSSPAWQELTNNTPAVDNPPTSVASLLSQLADTEDIRNLTFQQSLPIISQLTDDSAFIDALKKMKKDQDELERQLWTDREAIYTKYDEKFKVAQTKANMIGTVVSQHEAEMLTEAFKKEIDKFDRDRVIPAWDGLVSRQQMELAHSRVPTMFVSNQGEDRQRQQQVVNVLESILDTKRA